VREGESGGESGLNLRFVDLAVAGWPALTTVEVEASDLETLLNVLRTDLCRDGGGRSQLTATADDLLLITGSGEKDTVSGEEFLAA
jgi:hypothetical protein